MRRRRKPLIVYDNGYCWSELLSINLYLFVIPSSNCAASYVETFAGASSCLSADLYDFAGIKRVAVRISSKIQATDACSDY